MIPSVSKQSFLVIDFENKPNDLFRFCARLAVFLQSLAFKCADTVFDWSAKANWTVNQEGLSLLIANQIV